MNYPLLRRTQLSIADKTQPFDMMDWGTCICGHACHLAGVEVDEATAQEVLGLTDDQVNELFYNWGFARLDRDMAIAKIDYLIVMDTLESAEAEPEPEPEPELVPA